MRWWWRDSSHTDLTLPVTASSRWSMWNASTASGARRPVTGSRNQSGSTTSGRPAPNTSQSPSSRRSAAPTRALRASGGTCARTSGASGLWKRRAGSSPSTAGKASPGRTCRRAQRDLSRAVTHPEEQLLRRHPQEPLHVPPSGSAHGTTGRPDTRLSPTATVARVVATSDSSPIGMAAPSFTASRKASSSARCPLSCPVRERLVSRDAPAQTVARAKLSRRAFRPQPEMSNVSFGTRGSPSVQ